MANYKRLDDNGLLYYSRSIAQKVKDLIPTKLTDLTNDGNFVQDANYVHTDNNLTTALINKWNTAAEGTGEKNVIEIVKKNGVALTVDTSDKSVNVTVPTDADIETLITAHGYQTAAQVDTAITGKGYQTQSQVQTLINTALEDITGIEFRVVTELPASGEAGVIYLVGHQHGTSDIYDEYIWVNNAWEKIGSTDMDLSGYVQASEMSVVTNAEIDTIIATAFPS